MFGIFKRLRELEDRVESEISINDMRIKRFNKLAIALESQGLYGEKQYYNVAKDGKANPIELRDQLHALAKKLGYEIVENEAPTEKYKVRKGDSPYLIAKRYQMNLSDFLTLNNLTPRSTIFPGQIVLVKTQ